MEDNNTPLVSGASDRSENGAVRGRRQPALSASSRMMQTVGLVLGIVGITTVAWFGQWNPHPAKATYIIGAYLFLFYRLSRLWP